MKYLFYKNFYFYICFSVIKYIKHVKRADDSQKTKQNILNSFSKLPVLLKTLLLVILFLCYYIRGIFEK